MTDEMMEKCRAEFQKWADKEGYELIRLYSGQYRNFNTEKYWQGFQAAWNTRTSPTPPACESLNMPTLRPEGERTKADEWEACYRQLFAKLNPIMEENTRLKEVVQSANLYNPAPETLQSDAGNFTMGSVSSQDLKVSRVTPRNDPASCPHGDQVPDCMICNPHGVCSEISDIVIPISEPARADAHGNINDLGGKRPSNGDFSAHDTPQSEAECGARGARSARQPVGITNGRPCCYCCKSLPATDELEQFCNDGCKDAAHYKGLLSATPEPVTSSRPVDWTEDAAHENGNYQCRCLNCNRLFVGHKRRLVCKVCSIPSDCRKAFDQWLDADATPTLTARSKYYTAQEQVLGWLAFQAAWHMRVPEPVFIDLEKCIRAGREFLPSRSPLIYDASDPGNGKWAEEVMTEIAKAVIESIKEQGVEVVYGE